MENKNANENENEKEKEKLMGNQNEEIKDSKNQEELKTNVF